MEQKDSCIINVSSGLGFIPQSGIAVYSAVKSALHSFTFSLREQLTVSFRAHIID
ncbi:MAG: SDR family NAD(P)-dependent oxidoreductase [Clostridiales bacterium]|nr:SDR family NAD(P)-dependent oxidoreductase [Clostridiales bacterium]